MGVEAGRSAGATGGGSSSRGGCAVYVGRVGALAVALGVGLAVASTQGVGVAQAEAGSTGSADSSDSSGGASPSQSSQRPSTSDESADGEDESPGSDDEDDDAAVVDNDADDDADDDASQAADDADDDADAADDAPTDPDDDVDDESPSTPEPDDDTAQFEPIEDLSAAASIAEITDTTGPVASPAVKVAEVTTTTTVPLVGPSVPPVSPAAPTMLTLLAGFFRDVQRTFFNRAPDARSQSVSVKLAEFDGVSDPFALLARDRDGDPLVFSLLGSRGPRHGTVVFDQVSGTFTYNPNDAFALTGGIDRFTYKVSDASGHAHLPGLVSFLTKPDFGHADIATVTITVAPTLKSGIDLSQIDASVRPQDDFFGWLHGKWLAGHQIPPDRAADDYNWDLMDEIDTQIRELITELSQGGSGAGTDAQRIGDLYASFMDTETINRAGLRPLLAELAHIDGAVDADALAAVLGALNNVNVGFEAFVRADPKDSSRSLLQFYQAGLGLPDESYYRDPRYADILAAYPEHIANMLALVYGGSVGDYTLTAQRIVALESKLASSHWDVVKNRDPDATYNPRAFTDLSQEAPGFDWAGWAAASGITPEMSAEIIVYQPDYLTAFAAAWASEPLQVWKDWANWQTIHARAFLLTDDLVQEDFAFYRQRLAGATELGDRWKRGLTLVQDALGYAVGRLWVDQHFTPDAKEHVERMVDNLVAAYRDSITELEWMTPATREKALEKLDKLTVKVGYPEHWIDYSGVNIDRDDLYGSYLSAAAAAVDREFAKIGKPVDRGLWEMTPQTVNAYYDPTSNEIVFPAAQLQGVFFDPTADDALNYGGIGATIGHEIGHAFDDQGSRYDGDGNLVDWWTDADRAAFEARSRALIAQFDQYSPRQLQGGPKVNGELTLGENIADLGGLVIALKAYEKSLNGQPAPVIDGYTGVQRFFLSYAQSWRYKGRDADVLRRLAVDPHSPPEFRVNGTLRNVDAFYEAFGVTESHALYLSPEERVRIWY